VQDRLEEDPVEATVVTGRMRGVAPWAALAGVLYVVLFVIGVILEAAGAPNGDDAPAKVIAWYSDSGHRDRIAIGWIVAGLGIFFFIWFLAALRRAVDAVDGEGILATVTSLGGAIYAALAFAALGLDMAIRTMSDDTYRHEVFPELIHAAGDASYVIYATGAAGLGAMIIAASVAFMWAGAWPRWAGWLGVFAGLCAIAAIVFLTQFVFLLWILIVSLVLFRRASRTA
jgi:hypothetical protein